MNEAIYRTSSSRRRHRSRQGQERGLAKPEPWGQMPFDLIVGLLRTLSKGTKDISLDRKG